MRVAVCIYGQPRYVSNPTVPDCFFKNVVDKNPDLEFDFFTHYWFDKNDTEYFLHGGSKNTCQDLKVDPNTPQIIEKDYNFIRKLEERPRTFHGSEYDNEDFKRCLDFMAKDPVRYPENYLYSFLSTSYSLEKSVSLAVDYSRETKTHYDFGIITTYATKVDSFPYLRFVDKNRIYSNGRYGDKSFLLNFLLSDFSIINYRPYFHFKDYTNNICSWQPNSFEGDVIHREIYRRVKRDEYITNHPEIVVSIIRGNTDTVGQY